MAGEGEARCDAGEFEVFLNGGLQRKSLGAGERLIDVDGVDVLFFKVSVEVELLFSVIRRGFEICDGGFEGDKLQAMLRIEVGGEFLVEVDADLAVGVGNGDGAHGGGDEGNDVTDIVSVLLIKAGGLCFVGNALDAF